MPHHRTHITVAGQRPHRAGLAVRRLIIAAGCAVAITVTGLGLIAATRQPATRSAQSNPRTSDIIEVARGEFEITTTATGELRARNQIDIRNSLESETTIVEIIPEGTSVKAGELLIKLNSETIQTRIDEESLQLESSRAAVVEAEESYQIQVSENDSALRAAKLKLDLADLELEKWKSGEVQSKRQQFRHEVERTEKDEARLADKVTKSRALKEKGYYSQDQLTQDELQWSQAQASLAKAKLDQRVYDDFEYPKDKRTKESDVEEARAELERVARLNSSRLASKEADRTNKRSALSIREQKFQKYQEQLKAATIKAPSDGLVVYATSLDNARWGGDEGPFQVGSKVYPNQNLIILPDTSEMIAAVKVHESLAGRIRTGQAATIKVDAAGGDRFIGRVESIGILAEQSSRWMDPNLREYTVRIALDLPKNAEPVVETHTPEATGMPVPAKGSVHGLKPSMRCEAEVLLGTVKDAVTVPIQAIFSDGLVRFVHVQESGNDRFVRRPVLVGQRSDRFAEIRTGVEPGERILIRKPEPSEVLAGAWDPKQLAAAGLATNEQGQVVPIGGAPSKGGRGAPGMKGPPGAQPADGGGPEAAKRDAAPKGAEASKPGGALATPETKPEAKKADQAVTPTG